MTTYNEELATQVREALRTVIDPELGFNIVDLGLVYDVSVDDGVAHITMTATSRGCPAAAYLREGASSSACLVSGIESVDVTMTFDPPWRPPMISPGLRASLGFSEVN